MHKSYQVVAKKQAIEMLKNSNRMRSIHVFTVKQATTRQEKRDRVASDRMQ